uniref:Spermatogenesis associated glutamate (E)-rich protein 4C like 3 n=1 Tax=Rattus norvegicus TaxID=10116 RepID=F1LX92_RAT
TGMLARLHGQFQRERVDSGESRVRAEEGGLSTERNGGGRRWSWGMWRGVRQTSTPATVLSQKQYKKEEERIIRELQLATQERNELRDRLIYITEGSMNKRPYFKPNPFYEKLKKKEKEVMSLLHNLRTENPDMTENLQELKKEMNFYRNLHSRIILEKTLMKKKLVKLKQENKGVQLDGAVLQKYLFHLNMNDKDGQEKTSTLQTQQHQFETARELQLDTSQEKSLLKTELLFQETPAKNPPEHPQNSLDEYSSS